MADKYVILSVKDHVKSKDMWAGSKEKITAKMLIFKETGAQLDSELADVLYSPALYKCIDEPIVNALDHYTRTQNLGKPRTVSKIDVDFNRTTGRISVSNDGDGIPVQIHESGNYVPQIVFGVIFAGSNMRNESSSTIGGTNGVGVKITNIFSTEFHIRTYDLKQKLEYTQAWRDCMNVCDEPVIEKQVLPAYIGTTVTFDLDYAQFATAPADIESLLFTRVVWAAMYMTLIKSGVSVSWCGRPITYGIAEYARAIFGTDTAYVETNVPNATVIVSIGKSPKIEMSVINGIVVPAGSHLKHVVSQLSDRAKEEISKLTKAKSAAANQQHRLAKISTIIIWRAPNVHWTSQTKDKAHFTRDILDKHLTLSASFVERISERIVDAFVHSGGTASALKRAVKIDVDKYTEAKKSLSRSPTERAKCRLMVAEGDSAITRVKLGISRALSFEYYGILSLGGVIPNVRKETTVKLDRNGRKTFVLSAMLAKNLFFKNIVSVLGLDLTKTYETEAERATLNYGGIIGCVDQDLDGTGNIFSLLLNLFHVYFPALIEAGYVHRLASPIQRAYPKGAKADARAKKGKTAIREFYNDEEYKVWLRTTPEEIRAKYRIKYYKGLGSHNDDETVSIFSNLNTRRITYRNDANALKFFEIYLGADPDLRKDVLSKPAPEADPVRDLEILERGTMDSSYHLQREAHQYMLDNLRRKLNDAIGGMNQVGCKIVDGCLKLFAQSNEERKVASLAGEISAMENYHHGEASMEDAIKHRAFIDVGGIQLPIFCPQGAFGSRLHGGKDAASSRYIFTALNKRLTNLLFNSDDYHLLDFHFDEGKRGEPINFVPIIPLAICENVSLPSHGWGINIWAREVMDVIDNVRILIHTNGQGLLHPMRPCCYPMGPVEPYGELPAWNADGTRVICNCVQPTEARYQWHGYIIEKMGNPNAVWSTGTYYWETNDKLVIDELPLCVWTEEYAKLLIQAADCDKHDPKDLLLASVDYTPTPNIVSIRVTFNTQHPDFTPIADHHFYQSGARGLAHHAPPDMFDPVIITLGLRARMADNLNMMMPDNRVRSFERYEDVVYAWFAARRDLYAARYERQREILHLWIEYYENVIRYIENATTSGASPIANKEDAEAIDWLASENYASLKMSVLRNPESKFSKNLIALVKPADSKEYDYILDLRERDLLASSLAKFRADLEKHYKELAEMEAMNRGVLFIGAKVWLAELDKLEGVIAYGRRTLWQYEDYGAYTFGGAK